MFQVAGFRRGKERQYRVTARRRRPGLGERRLEPATVGLSDTSNQRSSSRAMKTKVLSSLLVATAWAFQAGQTQQVTPDPGPLSAEHYSGVMGNGVGGVPTYVRPLGWGVTAGCPQVGYGQTAPDGDDFWLNSEPWKVGFDAIGFADVQGSYYPQVTDWVRVSIRSLAEGRPFPGALLFEDFQHQNDGWFRFKARPWSTPNSRPAPIRFELAFDNPVTGETNYWLGTTCCYDAAVLNPIYRGIAADGTRGPWQHFTQSGTLPLGNLYRTADGRPYRLLFELDPQRLSQSPGVQRWQEVEIAQALPYTLEDRADFWATWLSTQQIPNVTIAQRTDFDGDGLPDYGGLHGEPNYPEDHAMVAWEISKTDAPARDIVLVTAGVHYEPPGNFAAQGFIREVLAHPEWLEHLSFIFIPVMNPDAYEWGMTHVPPFGNNAEAAAPNTLCDLVNWWSQFDLERYGFGALADPEARSLHAYLSGVKHRVGSRIVLHLDLHADLCPHPNRWTVADSLPPSIYGYIEHYADQDRERAHALVRLLAAPETGSVPAWNRFSWPYYRRLDVLQAWQTSRYADDSTTNWLSYFDKYGIPLHITFEYDELALYRDVTLPKPPWIQTPLIANHGGYAVDGYIDDIGRQTGGSDRYVFEAWGRELAQAVKRVFGQPIELWEDWNVQSQTNGWYQYTGVPLGSAIGWRATGGVANSGFALANLDALVAWPPGSRLFYPLNTFAEWHSIDLRVTPSVTVSVHATPLAGGMTADLRGGSLRFFVGQWNSDQEHGFYAFGKARFEVAAGGWIRSTVTVNDRAADWLLLVAPEGQGSRTIPLESLLPNPQQWGFVVVGATGEPTAWLGFDNLRVARRFARELWDWPTDVNGWAFYDGAAEEPQVEWSAAGGVGDSGFAWCPLDELAKWSYTPGALYPLGTYGAASNRVLHSLDLLDRNVVSLSVNPHCVIDGTPAPPAALEGGALGFFVGEWHSNTDYTYYRYLREALEPGADGWRANRITLTRHAADWQLLRGVGPSRAKSLAEILADPQQWGVGLFGGSELPTGVLGFDRLAIQCQAHDWNRAHDTNGWFYYAGSDPGVPVPWQAQGGWEGSGCLVCPLDALNTSDATGPGRYYPLYTLAEHQRVNLLEKPGVQVALNLAPNGGAPADLQGRLTLFVGQWDDDTHYVFYFFKGDFGLPTGEGWSLATIQLTANAADWEAIGPGVASRPLVELLGNPQQWGLAIVEAPDPPTGSLGIDELEVSPRLAQVGIARPVATATIELSLNGSAHGCVCLESAETLSAPIRWRPHAIVNLDRSGGATWLEPMNSGTPQRFYRILPEP